MGVITLACPNFRCVLAKPPLEVWARVSHYIPLYYVDVTYPFLIKINPNGFDVSLVTLTAHMRYNPFNSLQPVQYMADNLQIFKCSVELTICQHYFRQWLGACQAPSHSLKQCWPIYIRSLMASLGHSELSLVSTFPCDGSLIYKLKWLSFRGIPSGEIWKS